MWEQNDVKVWLTYEYTFYLSIPVFIIYVELCYGLTFTACLLSFPQGELLQRSWYDYLSEVVSSNKQADS